MALTSVSSWSWTTDMQPSVSASKMLVTRNNAPTATAFSADRLQFRRFSGELQIPVEAGSSPVSAVDIAMLRGNLQTTIHIPSTVSIPTSATAVATSIPTNTISEYAQPLSSSTLYSEVEVPWIFFAAMLVFAILGVEFLALAVYDLICLGLSAWQRQNNDVDGSDRSDIESGRAQIRATRSLVARLRQRQQQQQQQMQRDLIGGLDDSMADESEEAHCHDRQ